VIFVFLIIYCVYISCILCECVYINLMYCYIYCACLRVLLGWDWGLQNQRSVYQASKNMGLATNFKLFFLKKINNNSDI
jgi:hypothetical protein